MNIKKINILIIKVTLLVAFGLLLCEAHMLVYWIAPSAASVKGNWWLDKGYDDKVSVLWYIYELNNSIAKIMWFYAFAKVCQLISVKLFKVVLIFTVYFITQFAFWLWDRNTVFLSNFIVYLYLAIAVYMVTRKSHESAKIINLN